MLMSDVSVEKSMPKTAFGYLRFSDRKQEKGETLKNQKEAIEKFAKANNIKMARWFVDKAKSGKNTDRDGLQELLKVALKTKGKLDYVIVYKMNRASRDLDSYVTTMRSVLASCGVQVRSATEQFDDSPIGNFIEKIHVMVGQLDNENKRETVIDNMTLLAKQGYWQHKPPRGYKIAKIKNSDGNERPTIAKGYEADKVTALLMRFNRGDMIMADLCRYAISIDFLGENKKPVSQEVLTKMIERPEYAGYVHDKFTDYELVEGKHEGLISKDVYWQNQELLKQKSKPYLIGLKHHKKNIKTPLSRFINCTRCHKFMTRSNPDAPEIYRYYCARPSCRGTGSVLAEDAHDKFVSLLSRTEPKSSALKLLKVILLRTAKQQLGNTKEDLRLLHNKLQELDVTKTNIIKKYVNGGISDDEKQFITQEIESERDGLKKQIYEVEQQQSVSDTTVEAVLDFMENLSAQWPQASFDVQQKVQKLIFPKGFEYDIKNDNFIINEISPLYRCITPEIETDYAENSVMVNRLLANWNLISSEIIRWNKTLRQISDENRLEAQYA